MRTIDADDLQKNKFHALPYTHITPTDCDAESYKRGWNDAIDAIMSEQPTIEPERKRGEWLDTETSYADVVRQECRCSVCKRLSPRPLGEFCRWCGADMREGAEQE